MLIDNIIGIIVAFLIAFIFISVYVYIIYTHISIKMIEKRLISLERKQFNLKKKLNNNLN